MSPYGGDDGIRTHDPLLAGQVLSQLSYTPIGVFVLCFFKDLEERACKACTDNPSKLNNKRRVLESRRPWLVSTFELHSILLDVVSSP